MVQGYESESSESEVGIDQALELPIIQEDDSDWTQQENSLN